ncbi:MAG: hypothetical protein CMF39_01645 [Legionellaceae bacterium]|nr:hypothetical protein [Legionellaceae bacterium]|tara:strand:- start:835 stop:1101 length:267 start_codon:yes stop_codon:yes gene_type:complete
MSQAVSPEEVVQAIKGIGEVDVNKLDYHNDLIKQGYDSLDLIDILFTLQEKFGFEISEDSIADNEWSSIDKIVLQINNIISHSESKNA